MYPNLYYLLKDLFNISIPVLRHISTFGFFVALCFLIGIYFFRRELLRKEAQGIFTYKEKKTYKSHPPQMHQTRIWPSDRMGDVILFAAIFGLIGGKLFYCLENWSLFMEDPTSMILSLRGITFYGSLILSAAAIWIYFQSNKVSIINAADAISPALMIAYAVGRIGCHLSGDGDWGIINDSPKPFSWLPSWIWAYDYPHNVSLKGTPMAHCDWGEYCYHLVPAVYPTAFYETVICFLLFLMLWWLRKRLVVPGKLAAVYLIVSGLERFFIEKIRVNPVVNLWGLHGTQAEIIASVFVVGGLVMYFIITRHRRMQGNVFN